MNGEWNCPGYQANISDRQCLINREMRRHIELVPPCRGCFRGEQLAQALPELVSQLAAKYRSDLAVNYFKTLRFCRFF